MQQLLNFMSDGKLRLVSPSGTAKVSDSGQSKQYLTTHTIDHGKTTANRRSFQDIFTYQALAHPTDIFCLGTTASQILSSSGSSSIQVHSTDQANFPLLQTLDNAHGLGCHHIVVSRNGQTAASVGFGGEVKIWAAQDDGRWIERTKIVGAAFPSPTLSRLNRLKC